MSYTPLYIETYKSGNLDEKIDILYQRLRNCDICPHGCGVNRIEGEKGICKTDKQAIVASYHPHFGEEAPLVHTHGSGTIFFSFCNMLCIFCQNYDISHLGHGKPVTCDELAYMMVELQRRGCHNINFVTPTHVIPQIVKALKIAIENGLHIPLVYNTGGYDDVSTLKLLEGVIDIYMPDFKFWENEIAYITCKACDYPEKARLAIKEMHRQVGDLVMNENGLALKGLLIRHLVLPNILTNTQRIIEFIAREISVNSYVNIMPQYYPAGRAKEVKAISRPLLQREFDEAIHFAVKEGLHRLDKREFISF